MQRQDSWTNEDDLLLADTVIKHIETGKTQLEAFEAVANILSRTAAACGFRWNSSVRKRCEERIQQAKITRNKDKSIKQNPSDNSNKSNPSFDEVINYLKYIKLYLENSNKELLFLRQKVSEIDSGTPSILRPEEINKLVTAMEKIIQQNEKEMPTG
ncbi:RsfA family transcriptional regulator [Paenibacillus spiritus]